MRNQHLTFTPLTPDPNGLFEDQTTAGAEELTLDGAGVSGGVWTTSDNMAHQMSLESTGNLSGVNFTFTGFSDKHDHKSVTETIAGPNNSTVETTNYFWKVTSVTTSAAAGTNVEGGPVDEAVSDIIPVSHRNPDFELALICDITGTIDYSVEHTGSDINNPDAVIKWQDHSVLAAQTASANSNLEYPPMAIRLKLNSYTAGASIDFNIITQG